MSTIPVMAFLASLESAKTGHSEDELEHVYYGKLTDYEALKAAAVAVEHQKQFSIMKPNGSIRVRAVDNETFELTSKIWTPGVNGKKEVTNPTSRDQFEHFEVIGDSGMEKIRYDVIIPNTEGTRKPTTANPQPKYNGSLFWEYDVFIKNGQPTEWIKVDLEVPDLQLEVPLPNWLSDAITAQFGERTEEQEQFIKSLYRDHFTITPAA